MRLHFNLNAHIIFAQPLNTNTCIQRLMVGHPLLEVPAHSFEGFSVDGNMVRSYFVHLRPTLSASGLQCEINIRKSLVDLGIDFSGD